MDEIKIQAFTVAILGKILSFQIKTTPFSHQVTIASFLLAGTVRMYVYHSLRSVDICTLHSGHAHVYSNI